MTATTLSSLTAMTTGFAVGDFLIYEDISVAAASKVKKIALPYLSAALRVGRVSTEASSATPTINTDLVDAHSITALGTAVTSMTTNLSGTPVDFQELKIRFLDDGTNRAIAWGASFEATGVALPGTTTANKVLTVSFIYDIISAKWGCVASVEEA